MFNGYSERYAVGYAMEVYGGGFASNLGKALQHADDENRRKIQETWPELWEKYRAMARRMERFGGDGDE